MEGRQARCRRVATSAVKRFHPTYVDLRHSAADGFSNTDSLPTLGSQPPPHETTSLYILVDRKRGGTETDAPQCLYEF